MRCIGKMPERHCVSGNALISRPSARLGAPFARSAATRARAGTQGPHDVTLPGSRVSRSLPLGRAKRGPGARPGHESRARPRGRASARLHIPHAIRYSAHAGCRREDEHALPVARDPQSHYPDQAGGAKPWCSDRSATNLKPIVRSEQLRPNRTFTMRRLARGGVRGLRQPCCSGCPERSCPHPRRTNQSRHWYAPIPTSSQVMTKRT